MGEGLCQGLCKPLLHIMIKIFTGVAQFLLLLDRHILREGGVCEGVREELGFKNKIEFFLVHL